MKTLLILILVCLASVPAQAQAPEFLLEWGTVGTDDGQFLAPGGITADNSGNVFVSDLNAHHVQKFDAEGNFVVKWGSFGSGTGQFNVPLGMALDDDGNLYVAEFNGNRVQKFTSNGVFIRSWGVTGSDPGEFSSPTGIDIDDQGNVYVCDQNNNRIQKFTVHGTFRMTFGSAGSQDGQFSFPSGVAVDHAGNVFVADRLHDLIQKFDSTGTFLMKWGGSGSGEDEFTNLFGIEVDPAGDVYALDFTLDRIQRFTGDGQFIVEWGTSGSGPGQFNQPRDLLVDESGNYFVTDQGNARVQRFMAPPEPQITAITDVAPDQGGQVRITVDQSSRDVLVSPTPIIQYEIFRRIDPLPAAEGDVPIVTRAAERAREAGMISDAGVLSAGWDYVTAVPAHAEPEYNTVASTLGDSTVTDGMHWSVFFVRAATASPPVYFDSPPDSGYSLDNLAPSVPSNLVYTQTGLLVWDGSPDGDFDYFTVYGATMISTEPTLTLIDHTVSPYMDVAATPFPIYYVTATDFAGNESELASAMVASAAPRASAGPLALSVSPNPFNPVVRVSYTLPQGGPVTLSVFDAGGRLLDTPIDGEPRSAGPHQFMYHPRLPSGVYFIRLSTTGATRTVKAVVLQ